MRGSDTVRGTGARSSAARVRAGLLLLLLLLIAAPLTSSGCAARQPAAPGIVETPGFGEVEPTPAEESWSDKVGEGGVAVLVVVVTLAGILVPLLLL